MTEQGGVGTFSTDGQWWWDGTAWKRAQSEDGLWRWDGGRWLPVVPLDPQNPASVAAFLSAGADEKYAAAGGLLASRHTEWQPSPALFPAMGQADQLVARIQADDTQLQAIDNPPDQGLSRLLKKVGGQFERMNLDHDRQAAATELRQLIGTIGRSAPATTFPEADAHLEVARRLDAEAEGLRQALSAQQVAEQEHAARVSAAQQKLAAAQQARDQALGAAAAALQTAQAQHAQAVASVTGQLSALRVPGPGQAILAYGPLQLFENVVQTPEGRGPTAGATAVLDTAAHLYEKRRAHVLRIISLGGPAAEAFQQSQATAPDSMFVLLETEGADALVPCQAGTEDMARQFVAAVGEAAGRASAQEKARGEAITAAEAEVKRVTAEVAAVTAAQAELARVQADPSLSAPIEAAQADLERATADTAALDAARAGVQALVSRAVTPPAPLVPAVPTPPGAGGPAGTPMPPGGAPAPARPASP